MSEAVNRCWIGLGGGQAPKLCVGGGDAQEMRDNIAALFGTDMVETMLNYFANEAEVAVHRAAKQAVMDAGIAANPQGAAKDAGGAAASAPAATGSPAQTLASVPTEEKDKYDNVFTYNVPGAPSCPHGPRVRKAGKSRANKDYVGWTCVTQTPYAQRSGIPKDDGCKMEWA